MEGLRKGRCALLVVSLLVLHLVALAGQTEQAWAEIRLERTDDGQAIVVRDLEEVLSQSGVVARLAEGERLSVFGTDVETRADSTIFLALSSEYFLAACLSGMIESGSNSAEPGQVLVMRLDEPTAQTFYFDVERFLATSLLVRPSDSSITKRTRNTSRCSLVEARNKLSNLPRSSVVNTIGLALIRAKL